MASLPDLYRALVASNKWLIAERDSLYDNISDSKGIVANHDDRAFLDSLDKVIDANQAALAKTLGGS